MAKTNPEAVQQFSVTLIIAMVITALLAFGTLAVIYGCAKANGAPQTNTPTTGMILPYF